MPVENTCCSHSMRWIAQAKIASIIFGMLICPNSNKNLQYLISSQKLGLNVLNVALFKFILWKRKKAKFNENRPFHGFFNFWHGSGAVNASKTMRKPL